MTESEAKTKWCSQVRFFVEADEMTDNRGTFQGENPCACIGSLCALWVWDERPTKDENGVPYKSMVSGRCGLIGARP